MSLVDIKPGDAPRAGIEVFVAAPDGKVHVPIVEFQFHVTSCMCQVEPSVDPLWKDRGRGGGGGEGV